MMEPGDSPGGERLLFAISVFRSLRGPADDLLQNAAAVQNWPEAAVTVARHGLTPLMASRPPFNPANGTVPGDIIETARQARYRAVITHSAALAVLSQIDGAFGADGITYASLKGAGLYESLYKDVAPRSYVDIDLLISRERIPRCLEILEKLDYRPACGPLRMALLRRGHFHLPLESTDPRRPPIELHWALVDGMNLYRPREREVLARARTLTTARSAFRVLALEDQLVYLCMHTAKHGLLNDIGLRAGWSAARFCENGTGNRLTWFADLELFLEKHGDALDWEAAAGRIEEWNAGEAVRQSLLVLSVLQPASPATPALARLESVCRDPNNNAEGNARHRRSAGVMLRIAQRSGGMSEAFFFRPIRFLRLGGTLFPRKHLIQRYYREHRLVMLPWLYLTHPIRLLAKNLFQ
ncbi:MAG: nucleotidyltransferase family protein [Lentisphaerae bacterium]|nr:nucleotidyltransferase family protein [Lentisphaerota bacterium]